MVIGAHLSALSQAFDIRSSPMSCWQSTHLRAGFPECRGVGTRMAVYAPRSDVLETNPVGEETLELGYAITLTDDLATELRACRVEITSPHR